MFNKDAINDKGAVLDIPAVAGGVNVEAEGTGKIGGFEFQSTWQDLDLPSLQQQMEGEREGSGRVGKRGLYMDAALAVVQVRKPEFGTGRKVRRREEGVLAGGVRRICCGQGPAQLDHVQAVQAGTCPSCR
jgi:hypothetical protein